MAVGDSVDRAGAGALIPEEVSREIMQALPTQSAALSMFRQARMSRNQQRIPVLSLLPFAYFRTGDTGLSQTTKAEWANKYLNAEEVTCVVPIPETVLDDSEFDMWGEIKPLLVEAIGVTIDGAVLFGAQKPSSWPDAIVQGAAAAGSSFTRGSVVDQSFDLDISDTMKLVEDDGYDVSGFVARKNVKASLRGLRTADGALIFQPSLQAATPDTIYASKVSYLANDAWDNEQADLIAGDFTKGIIALRNDITWKLFKEASYYDPAGNLVFALAQQHMVALDVTIRLAFQVPNPINRQNMDNATRYPFAVLRPFGYGA